MVGTGSSIQKPFLSRYLLTPLVVFYAFHRLIIIDFCLFFLLVINTNTSGSLQIKLVVRFGYVIKLTTHCLTTVS